MHLQAAPLQRAAIALAWRPEWPVAVLVGAGWLVVASLQLSGRHSGHGAGPTAGSLTVVALGAWAVMSLVMMVPATLPAVRHVGLNSIRGRRHWAMAVYVTSFLAVWIVFGTVALGLVEAGRAAGVSDGRSLVLTLALATGWQLTRTKRRAILSCRRTVPLPPAGWRADRACARFGVLQAWRCILACWPLMLLMALLGHQLWPMTLLTIIVIAEERASRRERLVAPIACLFAAATVVAAVV